MAEVRELAEKARMASCFLATAAAEEKNKALKQIAEHLLSSKDIILEENKGDIAAARKKGISDALLDRLLLTPERIEQTANEISKIIAQDDPIGEEISKWTTYKGLEVSKVRVPLGVVGIIYESRPNVTVDAAVLCLKSGNAVILRGGSDAINSNIALTRVMQNSLSELGFPKECIQLIEDTDRKLVDEMLHLHGLIDVIIPRGSGRLISHVVENSSVPIIETGEGNCHIFVDESADLNSAIEICMNAKIQRPGVCNAVETLLVHENIAKKFLPKLISKMKKHNVEIRGCEKTRAIVKDIKVATPEDWATEFLDLILAVKVVSSVDEAIAHINKYSTKHTEAILSKDNSNIEKFFKEIDSSCIYANASTRFSDGFEFGFGSEIGISTQKLHARGPMALKELTTYKYTIVGTGQVRE